MNLLLCSRCGGAGGYAESCVLWSVKSDHFKNTKLGLYHNGFFIFKNLSKFNFFVISKLYYNIMYKFYLHICEEVFILKENFEAGFRNIFNKVNIISFENSLKKERICFCL